MRIPIEMPACMSCISGTWIAFHMEKTLADKQIIIYERIIRRDKWHACFTCWTWHSALAYRNRDFIAIFRFDWDEAKNIWISFKPTECILISLSVCTWNSTVAHTDAVCVWVTAFATDGFYKLRLSACVHKATFKWISSPKSHIKEEKTPHFHRKMLLAF